MDATWTAEVLALYDDAVVTAVHRAGATGSFTFEDPAGTLVALHLQCPFRLLWDGVLAIGSHDVHHPRQDLTGEESEGLDTVYDQRTDTLNAALLTARPRVTGASMGEAGALSVTWEPGFRLEVFPDCSGRIKMWRTFRLADGARRYTYPARLDQREG